MSRLLALAASVAGLMTDISRGAARVIPRPVMDFIGADRESPHRERERRAMNRLRFAAVRAGKDHFLKLDRAGSRWRSYRKPHAFPQYLAIARDGQGRRRYHYCNTRDQALTHHPYRIEHLNGHGQVTRRELVEVAS